MSPEAYKSLVAFCGVYGFTVFALILGTWALWAQKSHSLRLSVWVTACAPVWPVALIVYAVFLIGRAMLYGPRESEE